MGLAAIITEGAIANAAPTLANLVTPQLTAVHQAACAIADRYVGRNLATETAVEYYDGSKDTFLNLKRWPVTALTEVKHDLQGGYGQAPNSFGSDTVLVQGTDYYLDSARGILQLLRNVSGGRDWFARGFAWPTVSGQYGRGLVAPYMPASWGTVLGSVKVSYTAGLVTATGDLVSAVAQIASYLATINGTGGLNRSNVSYIDVSESLSQSQVIEQLRGGLSALGTSRQILDSYRSPYAGGWVLS